MLHTRMFHSLILVLMIKERNIHARNVTIQPDFQLSTTLNEIDFKFVFHGLWSKKQNILLQHMHKKEFWILTNKCGNNLKHKNEAE